MELYELAREYLAKEGYVTLLNETVDLCPIVVRIVAVDEKNVWFKVPSSVQAEKFTRPSTEVCHLFRWSTAEEIANFNASKLISEKVRRAYTD